MASEGEVHLRTGWWTTLVCLGEGSFRLDEGGFHLGEPESSYDKDAGDCLKPAYGLFGACYIARLRALVVCFVGIYMSKLALSFKGVIT